MKLSIGEAKMNYDEDKNIVSLGGVMRFVSLGDYKPVMQFFSTAVDQSKSNDPLEIDFRNLQFVNSPGIATFSLFVINSKKKGQPKIRMVFSRKHDWQERAAGNFKRIWDEVEVRI